MRLPEPMLCEARAVPYRLQSRLAAKGQCTSIAHRIRVVESKTVFVSARIPSTRNEVGETVTLAYS